MFPLISHCPSMFNGGHHVIVAATWRGACLSNGSFASLAADGASRRGVVRLFAEIRHWILRRNCLYWGNVGRCRVLATPLGSGALMLDAPHRFGQWSIYSIKNAFIRKTDKIIFHFLSVFELRTNLIPGLKKCGF